MKELFNTRVIITATFLIIVGMLGYVVYGTVSSEPSSEKLEEQGYVNTGKVKVAEGITCNAMIPECGQCLGKIVGGYCYERQ